MDSVGKLAEIKDMEEVIEGKEDHKKVFSEFLNRQEAHNQKVERMMKIITVCAAGVLLTTLVAAMVLVPRGMSALSEIEQMTPQAKQALESAQKVLEQVDAADPQQVLEDLNSLTREGEAAMQESVEELKKAVDVLEKIDIEALNQAVDNLGKAVSPLARLFGGN